MLTKIKRLDCLIEYPFFPLRSYDYDADEEIFYYPDIFRSYILTLPSKSFRGNASLLGREFLSIIKKLEYNSLVFLGDNVLPWLYQDNDYKPAKEAQQYLIENNIGKRFNGALVVNPASLVTFVKHLSWLTRCNASLPYFHFSDTGQNFIGHICKQGNLHINTLNQKTDQSIKLAVASSKFEYLKGNNCFNKFGKSSAIAGRSIKL